MIYNAVVSGPAWLHIVLAINYDESGGSFDHVLPSPAPIPLADAKAGNEDRLRKFRVANFLVSPRTPRGTVGHGLYDHTSVLRTIRVAMESLPLIVRDATANNLVDLLDLSQANLEALAFEVPEGPFGERCSLPSPMSNEWEGLCQLGWSYGLPTS